MTVGKFDPLLSSEKIKDSYIRYIRSVFRTDDSEYNELLEKQIGSDQVGNGPFLEISTNYQKSKSIKQLIDEGVLVPEFEKIISVDPSIFRLYSHQEQSIRKLSIPDTNGRLHSAVVATGTGSGKTESFLFPILNELLKEKTAGRLRHTVHALLLYPMNALANDQIDRIRAYLKNCPDITFGCYTGDTKQSRREALEHYHKIHKKENADGTVEPIDPLDNEMISRDEMLERPPHILVTNYAMLERLLILPKNESLFGKPDDNDWKYVVIDEAHTYGGAKGSEFAMLMRRIETRVNNHNLQFVLTSATIGKEGEEDKIAKFAEELCNVPFEANDVIKSVAMEVENGDSIDLGAAFYKDIAEQIREYDDLSNCKGDPNSTILGSSLHEIIRRYVGDEAGDPRDILFKLMSRDRLYQSIRNALNDNPMSVSQLSEKIGISQDTIADFVTTSSMASVMYGKDRIKIFNAKYHMFVKGFNGIYVTLSPNKSVIMSQTATHNVNGVDMHVFQISTCYNCGAIHILGNEKDGKLIQASSTGDDIPELCAYMLLKEDEIGKIPANNTKDYFHLCGKCGAICHYDPEGRPCSCDKKYISVVRRIQEGKEKKTECKRCGQNNNSQGVLRSLYLGQRAVSSVLMTALYGELSQDDNTDRRILCFSDSRNAAGQFPSIVEESHENMLAHRMIFEVLRREYRNDPEGIEAGKSFAYIRRRFKQLLMDQLEYDDDRAEEDSWAYLMREFSCNNSNKSLEYNNMISFSLRPDIKFNTLSSLGVEGTRMLYNVLIKDISDRGAVLCDNEFGYERIDHHKEVSSEEKGGNTIRYPTDKIEKYLRSFLTSSEIMEVKKNIFTNMSLLKKNRTGRCIDVENIVVSIPHGHYHCKKCEKNYPFAVKGYCIRCGTQSMEWVSQEVFRDGDPESIALDMDDHYVRLYSTMPMNLLKIEEHSGQIKREDGYKVQADFKDGKIDAISCSTTFEMGVDIGDLNTVFMRDVPPSPSNYIQRAGRVGRSANSFAYVLTFAKAQAHDMYYYNNPALMIKGNVPVPTIDVHSTRIIQRHINAIAISHYWRDNGVTEDAESISQSIGAITSYFNNPRPELIKHLKDVVPCEMQGEGDNKFDLDSLDWTKDMLDDRDGRLIEAVRQYNRDVEYIKNNYPDALKYQKDINVQNIEFLSNNLIIPKYAFPVDSVRLMSKSIMGRNDEFDLNRDLQIAITEYAPGAQIMVKKKLITSRYLRKPLGVQLNRWFFAYCKKCSKITIGLDRNSLGIRDQEGDVCCTCGAKLPPTSILLKPKYGFVYDRTTDVKRASINVPIKFYSSRVSYSGNIDASSLNKEMILNGRKVSEAYMVNGSLATYNLKQFSVCTSCGYAQQKDEDYKNEHVSPWGATCTHDPIKCYLGHEFKTDVALIDIGESYMTEGQANSVLFALVNGLSLGFNIDRREVGGCLQKVSNSYIFVLFDRTPGGVGYVKHLTDKDDFKIILNTALTSLRQCDCGDSDGHGSCYKCLRSYDNQFCHEELDRAEAIKILSKFEESI